MTTLPGQPLPMPNQPIDPSADQPTGQATEQLKVLMGQPEQPLGLLLRLWYYGRGLVGPALVCLLLVAALREPVLAWLRGADHYDEEALREWVWETRNPDRTLEELIQQYLKDARQCAQVLSRTKELASGEFEDPHRQIAINQVLIRREEIEEHLRAMAEPTTKMYPRQLPLFPLIYRFEVSFALDDLQEITKQDLANPIVWESGLISPLNTPSPNNPASKESQFRTLQFDLTNATVQLSYQLHAFDRRQQIEQEQQRRLAWLSPLALAALVLGGTWMFRTIHREHEHERARLHVLGQAYQAEQRLLSQERRTAEAERRLLEQRLATQAAERQALELKSHLLASISVMAGSYAHNIKNLLVRPNDLLRRCLEKRSGGSGGEEQQVQMLTEVQHTLGMVTERLDQILHTIRSDPEKVEFRHIDLNEVVRNLSANWVDLATDRWQMDLVLELSTEPLSLQADISHLQQAIENLLFNARDATIERRSQLRAAARIDFGSNPSPQDLSTQKKALREAAAWRGRVVLRTRKATLEEPEAAILEVLDNGIGMSEEVRQRCTEAHFSTKRDNALFQGHSTGMGLGLSFVVAILEHHKARWMIESRPQVGTTFRIQFATKTEENSKSSKSLG